MDADASVGIAIIVSALGLLIALVTWSHRKIETIRGRGAASIRDIRRGND